MSTQTNSVQKTNEDTNNRTLSESCFKHIETYSLELIKNHQEETSLILAKYLLDQYVTFESAKKLFEYINADTTILERTYNQMLS